MAVLLTALTRGVFMSSEYSVTLPDRHHDPFSSPIRHSQPLTPSSTRLPAPCAIHEARATQANDAAPKRTSHGDTRSPAVTESVQRLSRGGYVKVGAGKALILTTKGREIAEVMARRHRLLERWLTDSLGLNWTDAHEEAHRLEHALSPRVEERLAEMLGMPSTCPHGNPIPGMAKPRKVEPFPLAQAKEGVTVVVERITEEAEADKKLLEHLWRNDVRPGRRLTIVEVAPWAGTITAASNGQQITLGLPAAAKIWVYIE